MPSLPVSTLPLWYFSSYMNEEPDHPKSRAALHLGALSLGLHLYLAPHSQPLCFAAGISVRELDIGLPCDHRL